MLYSVILPCYNISKYLEKCLNSIFLNKTAQYEVILVNDGSTDNFFDVCNGYFNRDVSLANENVFTHSGKVVKVINKENGGISNARNTGISYVEGDYILFLDPDDYIEPHLFDALDKKLSQMPYDMLLYGFYRETEDQEGGITQEERLPLVDRECFTNEEVIRHVYPYYIGHSAESASEWMTTGKLKPLEWGSVWRIAYKTQIIQENKLLFDPTIKYSEDVIFNLECFIHANSFGVLPLCLYHYMVRGTGQLLSSLNIKIIANKKALLIARERIVNQLQEKGYAVGVTDYAGSNVLSVFEMMVRCPLKEWKNIKPYIQSPIVQESIKLVKVGKKLKFALPMRLLKWKMYYPLFMIIRLCGKLGIKTGF